LAHNVDVVTITHNQDIGKFSLKLFEYGLQSKAEKEATEAATLAATHVVFDRSEVVSVVEEDKTIGAVHETQEWE
jgi:hypothetical protein